MGNDHDARKRAKKRKAVEFEDGPTHADGKRVRKRRPATRRLCRGMCYGQPSRELLQAARSTRRPPLRCLLNAILPAANSDERGHAVDGGRCRG